MKTPRELYQIGPEEYQDLDFKMIKSIVDAHYPSGQNPKERKRLASTQGTAAVQEVDVEGRSSRKRVEEKNCQCSALQMITN